MIQICPGITSGRVLNGELYAQRLQKLIYLHLLTGCFMKISFHFSDQNAVAVLTIDFELVETAYDGRISIEAEILSSVLNLLKC